jgi:hypothetical protein
MFDTVGLVLLVVLAVCFTKLLSVSLFYTIYYMDEEDTTDDETRLKLISISMNLKI